MRILVIMCSLLMVFVSCQSEPKTDGQPAATQDQKEADSLAAEIEARRQLKRSENHTFITGQFDPADRAEFVLMDAKYGDKDSMYLQQETYDAYVNLYEAAKADGISLVIRSATRNFDRQKTIWENKWTGRQLLDGGINAAEAYPDPQERALKILEWSSMPGTSRHHWGTDFDINAFENAYFEEGVGKKVYDWMTAHAAEYGFCQPYTEKGPDRPWGYNEEKWHWSYQPLAAKYVSEANASLNNEDITGFLGSETAVDIMVKEKYILGINPACY